jgi:hypothetical protein
MGIVSLNQQQKRLQISSFEMSNEIVFSYFDKLPAGERDEKLHRALYIGVLALMEDRISAFLSKTANELGTELESLKIIFDMKKELFYKTSIKGTFAEEDIAEYLIEFISQQRYSDKIYLTGNSAGKLPKNKTGDIVCEVNGKDDLKIVFECKFDKGIRLGDIQSKDIFTKNSDTAWSQLLEAQANRDGKVSIIVFDISLIDNSILSVVQDVKFIPSVGFIAIIDSNKGDYKNLAIAFMLARDITLNSKAVSLDKDVLMLIINRVIKDISEAMNIKNLVLSNIDNCKKILMQLEKGMLLMEFNQKYLAKFLSDGQLSKDDLLNFYSGDDVKERYKAIEADIKTMGV